MVYFRVDSNDTISGGHIMRCLAIANALVDIGQKVCFLIADDNPISILEKADIRYINLCSDWQDLMSDVSQVRDIIRGNDTSFLLIDTYKITKKYVMALKPYCKIAYLGSKLEELGKLDLLINYSTYIDFRFYEEHYNSDTKLLLGPSYAPLRKEFQSIVPEYRENVKRILLTTGNTDKTHMVPAILQVVLPVISKKKIVIDVIVGRMFDNKEDLYKTYGDNLSICLHKEIRRMSDLMRNSELAISANGTTVYELSAMGLPTVSFAMVEEQVKSAEALDKLGVISYCGCSYQDKKTCVERVRKSLIYYLENNDERIKLAQKAHQLIDGNGCQKIIEELI